MHFSYPLLHVANRSPSSWHFSSTNFESLCVSLFFSPFQTIEANWRCGRHNLQRIQCRSENSKGVYCLQYDDDKIISGLRDNSIKVCGSWCKISGTDNSIHMPALLYCFILCHCAFPPTGPEERAPLSECVCIRRSFLSCNMMYFIC